jgi:hypothetical protein
MQRSQAVGGTALHLAGDIVAGTDRTGRTGGSHSCPRRIPCNEPA